ncbi:MAG: hypothetical protein K1X95_09380, partial [Acidimicrobiia bacterium]|nr:hypothetical protein [Acidimicrobiia bacterium]
MQDPSTAAASGGRLAEVCAALCLGSDLYTGFGYEHGIRATVIAAGIADALGMSADERVDVYYASLLAMLGCSSTPEIGEILGDYVSFGSAMAAAGVDPTSKREMGPFTIRHAGAGEPLARRLSLLARMMSSAAALAAGQLGHCEVATRFAQRLGLGGGIQHDLGFVYERWDGQGARGDSGESIPPAMRVVHVAKQAALHLTLGGVEAAVSIVGTRSGRAFEPGVAGTFIDRADVICEPVATGVGAWEAVLDAEPGTPRVLDPGELDAACEVAADMADQTSRWFHGHSRAVAALAGSAAAARGFDISEVVDVRR